MMKRANEMKRVHVQSRFELTERINIDFGVVDKSGRSIGLLIVRGILTNTLDNDAFDYVSENDLGTNHTVYIQTTRNGEGFGPTQKQHLFKTIEKANDFTRKKLKAIKDRYVTS
jgi:hypothetical protein